MKKIILILVCTFNIVNYVHAQEQSNKNNFAVDWTFQPSVSTHMGINLDHATLGMTGSATLNLKTIIRKETDEDFIAVANNNIYAKLEIKDLEIKFETYEQNENREDRTQNNNTKNTYSYGTSTNDNAKSPLLINWGDISGTLYLGPAYIHLAIEEHDKINFINNLKTFNFTSIEYNIISPQYTGRNLGDEVTSGPDKDESIAEAVLTNQENKENTASFILGYLIDSIIDIKFGISTKYSYADMLPENIPNNPIAPSININLLYVENFTFKFHFAFISGLEGRKVLEENNPISFGTLIKYDFTISNTLLLIPAFAFDLKIEKLSLESESKEYALSKKFTSLPFEIGLGLTLSWKNIGVSEQDKENIFRKKDTKVSDGLGIGFLYGLQFYQLTEQALFNVQSLDGYEAAKQIPLSYLGIKLTLWDSEIDGISGIIPGVEMGLIGNLNYLFGGVFGNSDKSTSLPSVVHVYPRLDIGLGFIMSYEISFFKPSIGLIYKAFNALNRKYTVVFSEQNFENIAYSSFRKYKDNQDLRLRLGLDIMKLIPNVVFTIQWESGDIFAQEYNSDTVEKSLAENTPNTHFTNENNNGEIMLYNNAQFGFIEFGATIEF